MQRNRTSIVLAFCILVYSCGDSHMTDDLRPKPEIAFLKRASDESLYGPNANAADRDTHIKAFNKYAADSLKDIKDWEMIVTNVNDDAFKINSVAESIGYDKLPCYNVMLAAPITPFKGDPLAIGNQVEFTYTLLKEPNNANLEKRIGLIKTLNPGDTVIVSGTLTHIENSKLNFEPLYNGEDWNVDLVATKF